MALTPERFSHLDSIISRLVSFEFDGLIGHGDRSSVFKALQRSLGREVAIRIYSQRLESDSEDANAFKRRVKTMIGLVHPNLVRVYDCGDVDGYPHLVMEYVSGKSLQHCAKGKPVDPLQAVKIMIAVCQGLSHAHEHGLVMGGIVPTKILLSPKCEPKISDYGLAFNRTPEALAYMAPEFADGSVCGGPAGDVFSIGVILRELLTGKAAEFGMAPMRIADAKLEAICAKATHPDPAQRFAGPNAVEEALKSWLPAIKVLQTTRRPNAAINRPKVVLTPRATPKPDRTLATHALVIGCLMVAIYGAWGVFQQRKDEVARLQQLEDSKAPLVVVKASPRKIESTRQAKQADPLRLVNLTSDK